MKISLARGAAAVLVLIVVLGIWFYLSTYQGRSISRWTG